MHLRSSWASGHLLLLKLQGENRVKGSHIWATYRLCPRSDCLPTWRKSFFPPHLYLHREQCQGNRESERWGPAVLKSPSISGSHFTYLQIGPDAPEDDFQLKLHLMLFFSLGGSQEVIRGQEVAPHPQPTAANFLQPASCRLLLFPCFLPQASVIPSACLSGLPLALQPTNTPSTGSHRQEIWGNVFVTRTSSR